MENRLGSGRLSGCFWQCREIVASPFAQGHDHRPQAFAFGSQGIFHASGHFRVDGSQDQPRRFEFPQLPRQHALRNGRQLAPQFAESHRPLQQVIEHEAFPFSADELKRRFRRAAGEQSYLGGFMGAPRGPRQAGIQTGTMFKYYAYLRRCMRLPTLSFTRAGSQSAARETTIP